MDGIALGDIKGDAMVPSSIAIPLCTKVSIDEASGFFIGIERLCLSSPR